MSKFQKIASLFIVGVKDCRYTKDLENFLKTFRVSGLALFNSPFDSPDNIWGDKQASLEIVHDFISRTQQKVNFIAADQEGGRVRRLRGHFVNLPSAQKASQMAERSAERMRRIYELAALQMAATGIRLNFAPVCDLRTNDSNNVVGDRSFGSDRLRVIQMAKLFCESFERSGVHTTLKHFPGHGPTRFDSHEQLALISKNLDSYRSEDASIFKEVAELASAVMTAHIGFEDSGSIPFSLNAALFEKFKNELPAGKALITDDLQNMKAVSELKPWVRALELPYDFILLCGSLDQAAQSIEEAIRHIERTTTSFSQEERLDDRLKQSQSLFLSESKIEPFSRWKQQIVGWEEEAAQYLEAFADVG